MIQNYFTNKCRFHVIWWMLEDDKIKKKYKIF